MANEQYQRLPEEERRNLNQITYPDLARSLAETEKPIRDLARDQEADQRVKDLKPVLDREADRVATVESQTSEMKLLAQSVNVIELSSPYLTTLFHSQIARRSIETVNDLITQMPELNLGKKTRAEVRGWLTAHGVTLDR